MGLSKKLLGIVVVVIALGIALHAHNLQVEKFAAEGPALQDGAFIGEGEGYIGAIQVEVTIESGQIVAVGVLEHEETPGISDPAIQEIPASIVETQSAEVDDVTGATGTSKGIREAVADALAKASK